MTKQTTAIVTTTINLPTFLDRYVQNFEKYKINPEEVIFILVGDKKSREQHKIYAENLSSFYPIEFWLPSEQKIWLKNSFSMSQKSIDGVIPWNSIRRRNFGYLRAMELGVDTIITIDDDNMPRDKDWLNGHLSAFDNNLLPMVSSSNKVINHCRMLKTQETIYPRGYPQSKVFFDTFEVEKLAMNKIILNMGLWTAKPDVDAFTNILYPNLESNGFAMPKNRFVVSKDNYIPINTQNTAFLSEVTPAFYVMKMDTPMLGTKIDRYDDIWAGWILQKIAHKFGETVSFGRPLSNHERNTHDYVKDLKYELVGSILNNKVFEAIDNKNIEANNYKDAYSEMADVFYDMDITNHKIKKYFIDLANCMKRWVLMTEEFI